MAGSRKVLTWAAALIGVTSLGLQAGGAGRASISGATLATPEQSAAEATLLKLLADPDVQAAQAAAREQLAKTPIGQTPDGAVRIEHDVSAWTGGLIMRWLSGDPERPAILLTTDNTPRRWLGRDIPATGAAGDNPDHVYRNSFIDGGGRYEIRGRFDLKHRPVQFSIEASRGSQGQVKVSSAASGVKVRNQLDIVTDKEMTIAPDGSFTIRIGPDEPDGPNSLRTERGITVTLILRDVLSNWNHEAPVALSLRRLDKPAGKVADYETVKQRVIADIPDYIAFWGAFPSMWMGGLAPNGHAGPTPRDGGWGYQGGIRYDLKPGEALLVTVSKGPADYLGFQVCDPFFLAVDGRAHVTSLTSHQATPNPDGSFTYAIAAEDPGVVNWLDTGGLHQGLAVIRWQGVPKDAFTQGWLREVKLVDRATLDRDYPAVPRLAPAKRQAQQAQHAAEYAKRWTF